MAENNAFKVVAQGDCMKQFVPYKASFPHAVGGNPVFFLASAKKFLDSRLTHAGMTVGVQWFLQTKWLHAISVVVAFILAIRVAFCVAFSVTFSQAGVVETGHPAALLAAMRGGRAILRVIVPDFQDGIDE